MKDVPKFTNKPNVYCSVCNLTKTKVTVSKHEHKHKPKYIDDSCCKLSTVSRRTDSVQFGKGSNRVYDSARS